MADLVERLQGCEPLNVDDQWLADLCEEAADEIERLRVENERLRSEREELCEHWYNEGKRVGKRVSGKQEQWGGT